MKRLINAGSLVDKLRTRKVMSGDKAVQDAYETAMWDALNEPEVTLNALRDEVYEDAVKHGLWESTDYTVKKIIDEQERYGTPFSDKDAILRAWAMEPIRREVNELEMAHESVEEYTEELADVIIMSLSVAGKLGIDIDEAVRRKIEFNKTRPWKHGKE